MYCYYIAVFLISKTWQSMAKGANMDKRFYWIKIQKEFFSTVITKKIRQLENGGDCFCIYQKLLINSLSNYGYIFFEDVQIPLYEQIALELDEKTENVKVLLELLQSMKKVQINEQDLFMVDYDKFTGSEAYSTQRVRKFRARKRDLEQKSKSNQDDTDKIHDVTECCNTLQSVTMKHNETLRNQDKEKDIDLEKEKEYIQIKHHPVLEQTEDPSTEKKSVVHNLGEKPPLLITNFPKREKDQAKRIDCPSKNTPEWTAFLSCWNLYPVQQSQEQAWREWTRLKANGTLEQAYIIRESIIDHENNDSRWKKGIIPNFANWLNGKRWNDKPFIEKSDVQREYNEILGY